MHYLTVDGMYSGTGIRDSVEGGYIDPAALGLSAELVERISRWLTRYEDAHYEQYKDEEEVEALDLEGIEICKHLRCELPQAKVEYFSNAKMRGILQL